MAGMTTRERMLKMLAHREADRVPVTDGPWGSTLERWRREGLPRDAPWQDYFGLDCFRGIGVDNSPRYPAQLVEETEEYRVPGASWRWPRNWDRMGSGIRRRGRLTPRQGLARRKGTALGIPAPGS